MESDFQSPAQQPIPPLEKEVSQEIKTPVTELYGEAKDIAENKDLAAFAYLWIMGPIMFFWKGSSRFVRFHSKQGCILFLISVIGFVFPWGTKFLQILVAGGSIWGFLLAAHGKKEDVPFIGPLSRGKVSPRNSWKRLVSGVAHSSNHIKIMWNEDHSVHAKKQSEAEQPNHEHVDTFSTAEKNVYYQDEENNQSETPAENSWQEPS